MSHDPWGNALTYPEDGPACTPSNPCMGCDLCADLRDHEGSVGSVWDKPSPLTVVARPPEFPVAAFPFWLRRFVEEIATATQTPVDLPAVLALGGLATAAGGRAVVEVRPGWTEPTNLFLATAMPPGARKSPVLRSIVQPIEAAERSMVDEVLPGIAEARARQTVWRDVSRQAEQKAAKAPGSAEREQFLDEAIRAAHEAEGVTVPSTPRLLADDATPQALASLLAEQEGRMAVMTDEGDLFDIMGGRYSGNVDLGVYLRGWDGGSLRIDRKGRPPEYVEHPALTLALAVQPDVLRQIADRPGFRGRGLLGRFLWSMPVSFVGWRNTNPAPVAEATRSAYAAHLRALIASLAEWIDPTRLPLTDEAHQVVVDYLDRIEPLLRPGERLAGIRDWAAKLAGNTVRIAGLLHLAHHVADGWGKSIEAQVVSAATEVGRYFTLHALAAFDHMGADQTLVDARVLLQWVKGRESFTRRDAHRAHQSRFAKVTDLDPVLDLLEVHGWIRRLPNPEPGPQGGRPPAPVFEVTPHDA
jgi:replicative DNA helicase